jgi:capsular exopolysaccharide synthesis family protein
LIEAYTEENKKRRLEYRDKALGRYLEELEVMRTRVMEQLDSKLKYEEESALASAQIELEKLSDIPVQLVRTKYRLSEIRRISEVVKEQGTALGTVGQLSLLTSIAQDKSDNLSNGRLVRGDQSTTPRAGDPVRFQQPGGEGGLTQVVIQPDIVEGLAPWKDLEKKKRGLEETERLSRTKYLPDHPEMRRLRDEIKSVDAALELELEVAKKASDTQIAQLTQELTDLEAKLPDYYSATKDYDQKRVGYDLMRRGQLAWDNAYERLAKQLEMMETDSGYDSIELELQHFTEMRDQIPVSPGKNQTATMGLLLGLMLAFGVPVFLRRMDSTVNDLNEFESSLGIPGLGLVPTTDPTVLNEINRSPAIGASVPNALLENFRLIRSGILLNPSPKGEAKTIMFTSARPGEGKTTTAVNVGWAFASQGDRVVVIDCDLRRGRIHDVTGLPNRPGMTDLLMGRATLQECLKKSPADNLWIISRGDVLPGTTELLNTDTFGAILDQLRGHFDRILLDTPPVLGLSETAFLQNYAEGVVLIVRSERTARKDVQDAFVLMQKLGAYFYGFVLNDVDFSRIANQYYYYYYSAQYYDSNWEEGDPHSTGTNEINAAKR